MKKLLLLATAIVTFSNIFAQSDNCATPTPVTIPSSGSTCVNGTTVNGTVDNITTSCNPTAVNFVWYQFTTTGTQNQITLTPGTMQNAVLVIDATTCSDGSIDFCNTATGSNAVTILNSQPVGTTVLISVASSSGNQGTFQLCINSYTPVNPAAGDECINALPYCNASQNLTVSSMAGFTGSGNKPSCWSGPGSNPTQDMFITFTVTQNGTIAWTGNPSTNNTEFDWAIFNSTAGCQGTQLSCNYNYDGQTGSNFGMAGAANNGEYNATINGVAGQTYTIRISNWSGNGSGFVFSWQGTAAIAPVANFTINPNSVTCGPSVTVNINNTSTGVPNWSFGNGNTYTGTTPPSQTYTTPGTYAITATIPGACPSTATQYVQLYGPLVATLSSTPASCPSTCNGTATIATLTGGNGVYTYTWNTGANTSSISNLCPGTYSVTIRNAVCNTSITESVTVTAGAGPTITATATPSAYCNGGSSTLTASGGNTYTWSPSTALSGTTGASVTASPTSTITYTVTGTNASGCFSTATVPVTVNPIPVITVNAASICIGNSATLTASGASTYTWSPSTALSTTTGATVTANPGSTTTYTVTGTSAAGCIGTATSIVTVNPLPVITVNSATICSGSSTTLTAAGGTNYTWSPSTSLSGTSGATVTASPTGTITYTITGTNANNCISTATSIVTVNPIPVANAGADVSFCSGGNATIGSAAVGGVTYSWSPATGLSSTSVSDPTVTLTNTGASTATSTYTVTATQAGCSATDIVVVSVYPYPIANAGSDVAFCSGGSATVGTASAAGVSYQWSPTTGLTNSTASSTTITLTNTGASPITITYTLSATQNGCLSSDVVVVTVNPYPVADAGGDVSICTGSTVSIGTASTPGYIYQWTPSGTLSNATVSNPVSTPAATTTYTVSVTFNGCVSSDQIIVSVGSLVPNAGSDVAICNGGSTTLTATGGTSYTWSPSTGLSATNTSTVTASPVVTTTYTVTATQGPCTGTDMVIVTVNPPPTADAGADIAICSGATGTLGAVSAAGYTYTWSPATGLSGTTVSNPTVTLTNAGSTPITATYTVTATQNGCSATDQVVVTINPIPVANAGTDVSFCSLGSSTIGSASVAGVTYLWTPVTGLNNSGVSNPTVTLVNNTAVNVTSTYTVTASANSCSSSDMIVVTIYPIPVADAGLDISFCSGGTGQIGSSTIAGNTYSWTPSTGLNDPTISNPTVSLTNSGISPITNTLTLSVTSADGCISSDIVVVTVNPIPVSDAGADAAYCSGSSATLGSTNTAGYTYSWSPSTGLSSTTVSNPTATVTNITSTPVVITYTVTTSLNGCQSTDEVVLTVYDQPSSNAGNDVSFCSGSSATIGVAGTGATYTWSPSTGLNDPSISDPTITLTNAGTSPVILTYTLTTAAGSCLATDEVIVTVNPLPVADAGADAAYCSGSTTILGTSVTPGYTYSWSPSTGLSSTSISDPVATVSNTAVTPLVITYTVSVSENNCSSTDDVVLTVYNQPVSDAGSDISFCSGSTGSIGSVSSTGLSYAWSPISGLSDPSISNPTITLTNGTTSVQTFTYTLTTFIGSCSSTDEVIVAVNPIPVSDAGTDIAICNGSTGTIGTTAVSGNTYSWSPITGLSSSVVSDPTVTISNTGASPLLTTFTVTTTSAGGCNSTDEVQVTVYPTPDANAGSDIMICSDATGFLGTTNTAGYTYQWSPATGLNNTTSSNPSVTVTNTTGNTINQIYIVTATQNGCSSADTVLVTIASPISAVTGHTDPNCNAACDGQVGVIASGGILPYTYSWSGGLQASSFVNNVCAGSYTVTITDSLGCSYTSAPEVVSEPVGLSSTVSSTDANCGQANGTATVNVTGGTGVYTYSWSSSSTGSTATSLTPGNYTVTFTDANNCSSSATVTVGNIGGPTASISVNVPVTCNNGSDGSLTASVTGGTGTYTYSWNTIPIQSTVTASGLPAGIYCVTVYDNAGCFTSICDTVLEPSGVTSGAGTDVTICLGSSTTLAGSGSGGNGGPYTFSWSPASSLSGSNTSSPTASPSSTTTYTVTATDSKGCISSTDEVIVSLYPAVAVTANGSGEVCYGGSLTISAIPSGGNGGPYSITWSPSSGLNSTTGLSITANPTITTTYTATASNACNASVATDTVVVTINQLPVVQFTPAVTEGCYPVSASFSNTTPNSVSCDWSFGDGTSSSTTCSPVHVYDDPGNYDVTLTVVDNNGCQNTATVINAVLVHDHPEAGFTMSPQPTTVINPLIQFSDSSGSDVSTWLWNFSDLDSSVVANPAFAFPDTGLYNVQLIVYNQYGCTDSITRQVKIDPEMVFYVPNAFTPNGDGKNDFFGPVGINIDPEEYQMLIFDRWGNLIFSTNSLVQPWNGKSNSGSEVSQEDVYIWKITARALDEKNTPIIKTGSVTLVK